MRKYSSKNKNIVTYIYVLTAAVLVIVIAALGIRADKAVRPVAEMQAQHFAEVYAETIIEKAAGNYIEANKLNYSDFAYVLYKDGKAVSIETIPYNINKLQSELALKVNKELSGARKISDSIPIGSLTGSYLLAGKGPSLKIRICPAGKADVTIKSEMESAGINQIRHRISAVVNAEVVSSLPLYSFDSNVSFEFLLAENVIIGDIPDLMPYTSRQR